MPIRRPCYFWQPLGDTSYICHLRYEENLTKQGKLFAKKMSICGKIFHDSFILKHRFFMCQPMVKGYFVIPQIQPLRDTNYSASLEPTLWRHILYFQQLQPSADICYIVYQHNQPFGGITYNEAVFQYNIYINIHFTCMPYKFHSNHIQDLYDH